MKQRPKFSFGGEKIATTSNGQTAEGRIIVFPWALPSLLFAILLILMVYVYVSSIVLIVGVQLDELLREETSEQERGILDVVVGR